jgi:hypothetical protein
MYCDVTATDKAKSKSDFFSVLFAGLYNKQKYEIHTIQG